MTAPVFILTDATVEPAGAARSAEPGASLVLTGAEARHAVTVRRLRAGERVDLSDGAGLRLVCAVTAAEGKDRLAVRVLERVEEPAPSHALVLVQALAKGGRDEQAVETATEVGADVVVPWQAGRSIAQWKGPKVTKGRERWQATASEAAKQARRARVPRVSEAMTTSQLAAWVREAAQAGGTVLVLHEEAVAPIGGVSLPERGTLAVVVGPEGGISAEETAALEDAGATTVRLGPHVMRTASAGPVALAVLAQRAGLWG
nr:16S rRNA (uracil(1498)-N(3))-methyltransferase [Actinomyces sp.]